MTNKKIALSILKTITDKNLVPEVSYLNRKNLEGETKRTPRIRFRFSPNKILGKPYQKLIQIEWEEIKAYRTEIVAILENRGDVWDDLMLVSEHETSVQSLFPKARDAYEPRNRMCW